MIVETSTGEERSLFVGGVIERLVRTRGGGDVCGPSCVCARGCLMCEKRE